MIIQNQTTQERPREKCLLRGGGDLSLRECVALILGSGPKELGCMGVARNLLNKPGSGLSDSFLQTSFFTAMETSPTAHLKGIKGLGPAGQARLIAAFELGKRYAGFLDQTRRNQKKPTKKSLLDLPERAMDRISQPLRSSPQEWLGFVPVDRNGNLHDFCLVDRGTRTHVNTDPVELFARILAFRPSALFLFHNHPTGDLEPSAADYDLTRRTRGLCQEFSIRLLGHGIVTYQDERWIVI